MSLSTSLACKAVRQQQRVIPLGRVNEQRAGYLTMDLGQEAWSKDPSSSFCSTTKKLIDSVKILHLNNGHSVFNTEIVIGDITH
jgi:hypothetical protein